MQSSASFRFYDTLNDFLPYPKKAVWVPYRFNGSPAVKDAIEAIGVPHPEVAIILINNTSVSFLHPLRAGDQVEVYPFTENNNLTHSHLLTSETPPQLFILDVHLGSLAKLLRLLGFDTLYRNDYDDKTIAHIAAAEQRVVLTRDVGLLKHRSIKWGYWLRSQAAEEQLKEVVSRFHLASRFTAFQRCLACNGLIEKVSKETILEKLPPKTIDYFDEFYQCASCKRIYWKGSHYKRMQQTLTRIMGIRKDVI